MRFVESSDGVRLAVYESGAAGRPTIVAVHGYPDDHRVWDGVAGRLEQHYHVVTYDVRGAGESDKPRRRSAYRMAHLVDDLAAVVDAVSPDAPVHLIGHDWGSIQSWAALTDLRCAARIASFTSISGPSLDHAAVWLRKVAQHPRAAARQLLASFYIVAFQLPRAPEAAMRSERMARALARADQHAVIDEDGATGQPPRSEADLVNGIQLYRANMLPRIGRPRPQPIDIPVQVLAASDDRHVTLELQTQAPQPYVANLSTRVIGGGHWAVFHSPAMIAGLVSEFVDQHVATHAG